MILIFIVKYVCNTSIQYTLYFFVTSLRKFSAGTRFFVLTIIMPTTNKKTCQMKKMKEKSANTTNDCSWGKIAKCQLFWLKRKENLKLKQVFLIWFLVFFLFSLEGRITMTTINKEKVITILTIGKNNNHKSNKIKIQFIMSPKDVGKCAYIHTYTWDEWNILHNCIY